MTVRKQKESGIISTILWIVQVLLAATFIWAGAMKLFQPTELPWTWIKESPKLVVISAIADLLAGFGLVMPSLLRVVPILTVYAAYGTSILMVVASVFHIIRGEISQIGFNVFILIAAIFIVWGRQKKIPTQSET